MRYNQLTQDQRHQVSSRMKAGHTPSEIAMILGRYKWQLAGKSILIPTLVAIGLSRLSSWLRNLDQPRSGHLSARRPGPMSPSGSDRIGARGKLVGGLKPKLMSLLVMDGFTSVFFLQDKAEGGDLYQHLRCQRQSRQRYDSYNRPGQLIEALMSGRW